MDGAASLPSQGRQLCPASCLHPSHGHGDFSVIWHSKVPSQPEQQFLPWTEEKISL